MKIGLFNAGSLGTKHEEFLAAMSESGVDIIAINETWIREGEKGLAPIVPGYRLRHKPRPTDIRSGRGGGVGFYVKKDFRIKICDNPNINSVEQMWLETKSNGKRIIIGTAYRPPWQDLNLFLDALTQSVTCLSYCDIMVLVGDFNINLMNGLDSKTKLFNDFIQCVNLTQYITDSTHFTDHSETLIDLICTDGKVRETSVNHIQDLGSHALVTVTLNLRKEKSRPHWLVSRSIKDINIQDFDQNLNCIPWSDINDLSEVNSMVTAFNYYILNLLDYHAPSKRILIKEHTYPWLTYTIKTMMNLRNESHKRYKVTKKESHKQYYKDLKKIVFESMEAEKCAYYKYYVNRCIKNPKLMWKNLKKHLVINKKKEQEIPGHLCNPENINKHFLDVPYVNSANMSTYTYFEFHRFGSSTFNLKTTSEDEIRKIICELKSNAIGTDQISLDMLQLSLPQSLSTITNIINRSIETSIFPNSWKTAIVKPLPKIGNPTTLKDLRPISILPCLSKILEKVVCRQMTKYLEDNNILPLLQSGFRKNHSTTTAIIDVVDNILSAQDQGMATILVLLDFSRAFDSINTTLLLSKLSYYGFSSSTINWFNSYFNDRSQYVKIDQSSGNHLVSSTSPVLRGVPQGSILSPILFALYTADMISYISHCKYHCYADDVQLYLSFAPQDTAEAEIKICQDLENIAVWSERNSLNLNPKKTKLMILGTKHTIVKVETFKPVIHVRRNIVERVFEARNLGLIFDANLHFETHVKNLVKNCFYRLKVLYRMRSYLNVDVRIRLCESLILSKLNYADAAYGPCLLGRSVKLIQRAQNACARFCFPIAPRTHVSPHLNNANMLKMDARRKLHLASLLFGVISTGKPGYLHSKIKWARENSKYPSRSVPQISMPYHRSAAFKGTFKFAACKIWNDLPPPVRLLKSLPSFQKAVKKFFLEKQIG